MEVGSRLGKPVKGGNATNAEEAIMLEYLRSWYKKTPYIQDKTAEKD